MTIELNLVCAISCVTFLHPKFEEYRKKNCGRYRRRIEMTTGTRTQTDRQTYTQVILYLSDTVDRQNYDTELTHTCNT